MNQILNQKNSIFKLKKSSQKNNKKTVFKTQFIFSVLLILTVITVFFINVHQKNSKEFTAQKISSNYNISKLYNNENSPSMVVHACDSSYLGG